MAKLVFYRQKRLDGGVRTAVTANGETILHLFEPGRRYTDPALLWSVDLRCEGRSLPVGPEAARRWLLDNAETIRTGFRAAAEEFAAGIDVDYWPQQWSILGAPKGQKMTIFFSAAKRMEGKRMPKVLRDIAEHWEERIEGLLTEEATLAQREDMQKLVLDTSVLIHHWQQCRAPQLARNTAEEALGWAKRLIAIRDTDAIVTPVYLEMVAGVRSGHELELPRAYLHAFRCIDERRILSSDWDEAIRWAERFPRRPKGRHRRRSRDREKDSRPRDLGDCLIRAIADRLKHSVETLDKWFPA